MPEKTRIPHTLLVASAIALFPFPAHAQRVDENAVAEARDAFGINVGSANLGLYDPSNVRGFSPAAAGNIRIEGLYVDKPANTTSRLVSGYRMLVGPAVLGHPFPAPSGVADYSLRKPDTADVLSISASADSFGGHFIEADGQLHEVLPHVGLAGGVGLYRYHQWFGGRSNTISSALIGRWRPSDGIDIMPFWSRIHVTHDEAVPTILVGDAGLPPDVTPRRFVGQHWARNRDAAYNSGVIANAAFGGWQFRTGLFRSVDRSPISYSPLFLDTQPSGRADRSVVAERDQASLATSGEIELSRSFAEGPRRHRITIAAWGRDQQRRYGATDEVDIGAGAIGRADFVPRPDFDFGAQTRDHVRQGTIGIAYQGRWGDHVTLDLGVQKTDYQKRVAAPGETPVVSNDAPWLFNAAAAVKASSAITLYAGISRGMEESDVAPMIAVNRNEAPPAIRTRQIDAGVRWAIGKSVNLVADLFQIEKPYYGLDGDRVFRRLGRIRHRGGEISLAGSPLPGLNIVAGAVALEARASGDEVAAGTIGRRPVGSTPLTAIASVDYRLPHWRAFSIDASVKRQASRVLSIDGSTRLPAHVQLDLGMRYRLRIAGKPAVLRVQAFNITNSFSWDIVGADAIQARNSRQISARLTIDL
jgi:iron complex outermembrane receptor protein